MTATPPVVNLEARSLVKKLCCIMAAVDHIEKKGRNLSQGYDFARESDITHALREQFAKENVFMLPDVVTAEYTTGQTAKGNPKRLCVLRVKFTLGVRIRAVRARQLPTIHCHAALLIEQPAHPRVTNRRHVCFERGLRVSA